MKETDKKLKIRNIKPTAMRELVLKVLTEQDRAISLADLEQKFDNPQLARTFSVRALQSFVNENSEISRMQVAAARPQ